MARNITLGMTLIVLAASVAAGVGTASSNGPVASATGSGHATLFGQERKFTFTATKYADGTVKGEARLNNRAQDRHLQVTLDCLVVDNNTAYMSGVVDSSSVPGDVGLLLNFAVVDNGEGANDPADQITPLASFVSPPACTDPEGQAILDLLLPIESGNVQVR